jgi:conjugal transfer pilin signal peptidase TrbI
MLVSQSVVRLFDQSDEQSAGHLYVTRIGEPVKRGDLVAFRWHGGATYPRGVTFIKRVAGAGGDVVSVRGGVYYVNGLVIGRAKTVTLAGVPLTPAAPGVIPDGHYFVATPNPNSLDSRCVDRKYSPARCNREGI